MTPGIVVEATILGAVAVTFAVLAVSEIIAVRRVRRENARNHQAWVDGCRDATRLGTRPPFPPNVLVRR